MMRIAVLSLLANLASPCTLGEGRHLDAQPGLNCQSRPHIHGSDFTNYFDYIHVYALAN
jgi:hypothetical protein